MNMIVDFCSTDSDVARPTYKPAFRSFFYFFFRHPLTAERADAMFGRTSGCALGHARRAARLLPASSGSGAGLLAKPGEACQEYQHSTQTREAQVRFDHKNQATNRRFQCFFAHIKYYILDGLMYVIIGLHSYGFAIISHLCCP